MCLTIFDLYRSQLLFDSDNEVDIGSYLRTNGVETRSYINFCFGTTISKRKFVITKSFKQLVKNFNDGFEILTIGGPKGVGKSLALAAIYALNKGKSPCLIISPLTLMSTIHFHGYVKEVFEEHKEGECFIVPGFSFWCHYTVTLI